MATRKPSTTPSDDTASAALPAAPKARRAAKTAAEKLPPSNVPFSRRLVLFQYLLGTLGVTDFERLRDWLNGPEREGVDEEGVSRFARTLIAQLRPPDEPSRFVLRVAVTQPTADTRETRATAVSSDDLLRFDSTIVALTKLVSRGRPASLIWKYFQYLSLLFVEIYLDRWMRDPETLRRELNAWVIEHNRFARDNLPQYALDDLRTLALWCATGSGKTLLMHMNVLQFRAAIERHRRTRAINRTLLVTPNESLSRQHLDEFARSNIPAIPFRRGSIGGLFDGRAVEVVESSKLAEEDGDKTVSVAAFEENNLVLVDEGHHGAGGEVIRRLRDRLSRSGFAFEYSATFGQAMKAAKKPELEADYARAVVFDYAYRRFYADGFGKDFRVLNVRDGGEEALHHRYLVACLLSYYQQLRIFEELPLAARPYQLDRPLWIFVGSSVNAVRNVNGKKVSDVQRVLQFLARFVANEQESVTAIQRLLDGNAKLLNEDGAELFENQFASLVELRVDGQVVFNDIVRRVFLAKAAAKIHVERLEGTDGEIALRLGDCEPFGLVNVGDASGLMKLLKQSEPDSFVLTERPIAYSLFDRLRAGENKVNILVGSQKFATGWDTARVSTMGLMNIGKGEGSQIIQLFGRGVRLRGHANSLKRSTALPPGTAPPPPKHLRRLETLQVFGVSADYMAAFEQYLRDEEVATETAEVVEIPVDVNKLPNPPLKTLRVKDGENWRTSGDRPAFGEIGDYLRKHPVKLDWYPRLDSVQSGGIYTARDALRDQPVYLTSHHIACLDLDKLVTILEAYRVSKDWTHLPIHRDAIPAVLANRDWYTLLAPPETLALDDPDKHRVWQSIAEALLQKYVERIAKVSRSTWEGTRIEYASIMANDANLQLLKVCENTSKPGQGYQVTMQTDNQTLLQQVREIAENKRDNASGKLEAIRFNRHLFSPLLWLPAGRMTEFTVKPVALNEGEGRFVTDLEAWYQSGQASLQGHELYLLRNRALAGIGFFDEGGFYPDFILWLTKGATQRIAFIDPKGLRNLETMQDRKIQLRRRIKEIEKSLADATVSLHSFIVSNTALKDVNWKGDDDEAAFARENVFFQSRPDYVAKIIDKILDV
jgi:superfamily II DNA or RNA helicase